MVVWTSDELNKIGTAEELELSSRRRDGRLRDPVTIWVVRVQEDLYVRAYKGQTGPWFLGTQESHEGRIRAGGIEKDVTFVKEMNLEINDRVSAAYRTKYRAYDAQYVDPMLTAQASEATLKPSG